MPLSRTPDRFRLRDVLQALKAGFIHVSPNPKKPDRGKVTNKMYAKHGRQERCDSAFWAAVDLGYADAETMAVTEAGLAWLAEQELLRAPVTITRKAGAV